MKKVSRIVQRQTLKQENKALKNILQHVEVVVKAQRLMEDAFRRGMEVGRSAVLAEQAQAQAQAAEVKVTVTAQAPVEELEQVPVQA